MTSADLEWYLRRRCEDELIERSDLSMHTRARALTAVGALPGSVADAVLGGYGRAWQLRGQYREYADPHGHVSPLLGQLTIRSCHARVDQPWGSVTLRSAVTTDSSTALAIKVEVTDRSVGNPFTGSFHHAQPITVRDDRRKTHTAHFNGGGDGTDLSGALVLDPPLRRDARWITLFDQRLELRDPPDDVTVMITEMPPTASLAERAVRYLERRLEVGSGGHHHHFGTDEDSAHVVFETYVDCGVLSADLPAVAASPAVAALFAADSAPPGPARPARLGRVGHRRRGGGGGGPVPVASRLIAAVTPEFDGIQVALVSLTSDTDGFTVDFHAGGPGTAHSLPHGLPFALTAQDDRGNRYVGEPHGWGSGSDGMSGTIAFHSLLDREATTLDLSISMDASTALVHVPLAWDDAQ